MLDTEVTPELAAEGLARDLVRAVQQARRDAGLDVSDRIALTVAGSADVLAAARTHEALITGETLATSYDVVAGADGRRRDGRRSPSAEVPSSPRVARSTARVATVRWPVAHEPTGVSATGCGRRAPTAAGTPR